jgi:multicomponent Na+:H+ antiporter subunit D
MIENVPLGAIFIIGALFVPFLKGKIKSSYILFLPVLAFITLLNMPDGKHWVCGFLDYNLILVRVDKLSRLFGYIFIIWAFLALLYSIHLKDKVQQTAALIYSGSALGIVFSGDLFSLYIFWEVLAISSTMLIWARRGRESIRAGFRYILRLSLFTSGFLMRILRQRLKAPYFYPCSLQRPEYMSWREHFPVLNSLHGWER